MPDLYSTNAMLGVIEGLPVPPSDLVDRFFGSVVQEDAEEVHFDRLSTKVRLAPFVSPHVEGQVVEGLGFTTDTFKPAYIKDKRRWDPTRALKRSAGERVGGSLSPQQRADAWLALQLTDQIQMVRNRQEAMASEIIRTGKVTVEGLKYPKAVLDFGRDAGLTPAALAGTARWGLSAEDPIGNLETWSGLVLDAGGVTPTEVIMGAAAFGAFRKNADVQVELNTLNIVGSELNAAVRPAPGLSLRGVIAGYRIWTIGGSYIDPITGAATALWPTDIVAMVSAGLEGIQFFGAILDGQAGYRAFPYFPKMWEDNDPPIVWQMLQSAPLLVPKRANASLAVDVL